MFRGVQYLFYSAHAGSDFNVFQTGSLKVQAAGLELSIVQTRYTCVLVRL